MVVKDQNKQLLLLADISTSSAVSVKNVNLKTTKVFLKPDRNKFSLQNRRFMGNKYKLLSFIDYVVVEKCGNFSTFCDIFAGTGVVGARFNKKKIKIISNDILFSNFIPIKAFLGSTKINLSALEEKIEYLNSLKPKNDNYFSMHYGGTYFTLENARKIGLAREEINQIADNEDEMAALIASLIYAVDKVANTVGHYDAFRKNLDTIQSLNLLLPSFELEKNHNNEIYNEDANLLIRKIACDVLYIDPPYNSRQYCDNYHLLENLAEWKKPAVVGKAKKMDRKYLKSAYCLKSATKAFSDLVDNANCKHILVSYNNTGETKDGRSNARIKDEEIINILESKGDVEIFEHNYKAFNAGKSNGDGHKERIFYCKVK